MYEFDLFVFFSKFFEGEWIRYLFILSGTCFFVGNEVYLGNGGKHGCQIKKVYFVQSVYVVVFFHLLSLFSLFSDVSLQIILHRHGTDPCGLFTKRRILWRLPCHVSPVGALTSSISFMTTSFLQRPGIR